MNGKKIYKDEIYRKRVKYKYEYKALFLKYKKFELLCHLRAFNKINFIRFNLKKIEIAKQLFLKDIEHGSEVYITNEMRQNQYPKSMHFYDSILIYLQDNMSID